MQPTHWLVLLSAEDELMGRFPQQLSGRSEIEPQPKVELCQRAYALVFPARILQKKGLFRFQDWD